MGRQDLAVNQLLERKEIFADLINGTLFQGKQILCEDELELLSGQSGLLYENEDGKKKALGRIGDIRMQGKMGTYSVIFSNETQSKVHYAMPVRNMLYDALEYTKQVQKLEKAHKDRGDKLSGDEFLSGITKEDRLYPVVTTVFYLGKEWDGCKSLYELLGINEENENRKHLQKYLPDYKINLIDARNMKNPEYFRTCLQHIFYMLKYNQDKKQLYQYVKDHNEELRKMDYVELQAAFVMLGEQKRLKKMMEEKEKKEEISVCQAIDDLIQDGKDEGKAEGKAEGKSEMIHTIRKKLGQGLSVREIADWMDLEERYVQEINVMNEQYPQEDDLQIAKRLLGIED